MRFFFRSFSEMATKLLQNNLPLHWCPPFKQEISDLITICCNHTLQALSTSCHLSTHQLLEDILFLMQHRDLHSDLLGGCEFLLQNIMFVLHQITTWSQGLPAPRTPSMSKSSSEDFETVVKRQSLGATEGERERKWRSSSIEDFNRFHHDFHFH